jgi:hypothetical protein
VLLTVTTTHRPATDLGYPLHKRRDRVQAFGLGIEALERFVRHEPLYRVHECVFAVLALESEPVAGWPT